MQLSQDQSEAVGEQSLTPVNAMTVEVDGSVIHDC